MPHPGGGERRRDEAHEAVSRVEFERVPARLEVPDARVLLTHRARGPGLEKRVRVWALVVPPHTEGNQLLQSQALKTPPPTRHLHSVDSPHTHQRAPPGNPTRTCTARNMRWIQVRGLRVRKLKKFCGYRQCAPRPKHTKCSRQ